MRHTTWDDVITRANQGSFDDMEVETEKCLTAPVKRGPIHRVFRDGHRIAIETLWMAFKDHSGEGWRNQHGTGMRVSDEIRPMIDKDNSSIVFFVPRLCQVRLFSKTRVGSALDPAMVAGLEADDVRKSRARQYRLPLDATWEEILAGMRDWAGDGGVSVEDQIILQQEAARFAIA